MLHPGGEASLLWYSSSPPPPPPRRRTYPEYLAVLVVAVLPGVVLPGDSELVLAHVAQTRVLARVHLSYEPAGKLRLGGAGRRETAVRGNILKITKDFTDYKEPE